MIATFQHKREDDLATCLKLAAKAAGKLNRESPYMPVDLNKVLRNALLNSVEVVNSGVNQTKKYTKKEVK